MDVALSALVPDHDQGFSVVGLPFRFTEAVRIVRISVIRSGDLTRALHEETDQWSSVGNPVTIDIAYIYGYKRRSEPSAWMTLRSGVKTKRAGSPAVWISFTKTSLPPKRETALKVPGVKGTRQET